MADAKKGIPAIGGAAALAAQASSKTGQSKKNPGRVRRLDGLVVKPFLFDGRAGGYGKYWAGYRPDNTKKDQTVWDAAVLDEDGRPVEFRLCGVLSY